MGPSPNVKRSVKIGVVITGCGLALAAGRSSHAAGFDCAKARTPVARAICGDPTASAADAPMGSVYAENADHRGR